MSKNKFKLAGKLNTAAKNIAGIFCDTAGTPGDIRKAVEDVIRALSTIQTQIIQDNNIQEKLSKCVSAGESEAVVKTASLMSPELIEKLAEEVDKLEFSSIPATFVAHSVMAALQASSFDWILKQYNQKIQELVLMEQISKLNSKIIH